VVAAGAGVAIAVVLLRSRMPPLKAIAGGLLGVGLLTEIGRRGPSWREAIGLLAIVVLAGVAARRTSDEARRSFALALSAGLALVAVAAGGFLFFAIPAAQDLQEAVELSQGATRVFTSQRGEEGAPSLSLAANAFARARERLSRWPARLVDAVPLVSQNAAALRGLAGAGEQVASAAAAATVGPSDLALAEGGLDLATLDDAAVGIRRARLAVAGAIEELDATRSRSLLPPLADASEELDARLQNAAPTLATLEQALGHLPAMLGRDGPRRYLLALQTPSESRAAGGIIGAFGVLEANGGRLALTRTGDAVALNNGGDPAARALSNEDEFTSRYGRFLPLQNWQNLSMTPDWPTVGRVASQLFPQSGGEPIDGVIGLDPLALAALLSATGPIEVPPWPVPLSAENARSVLLHEQYLYFPNPERKEFLGDVTAAVFNRLTGEGASLRALALSLAPAVRSGNVQMWAADAEEQQLLTNVSAAGEFPAAHESSDLLAVVNQNSSGNKIDWFLHRKTSYELTFDPVLGRVDAKVRIELRNDAPTRGLPEYVIGSAGPRESRTAPGENRTWVSVYTPLALEAASLDGQPLQMEQADELGRRVYSAFVTIPPGGKISLELNLGGPVDPDNSTYRLQLRSQVLPNPEQVTVTARFSEGWKATGKTRREFELKGNRQLVFGFQEAHD
ncbi:MAG TPA: DUF4012 domain-containing protein, partial [Acidimicrobiales bacterium]|nr:DUF4012 domain-containing protein [Acidimicrobiales bacterium]